MDSILDILDFAIHEEEEAYRFYNQLAEKVESTDMKKMFLQLAGEEVKHKEKLQHIRVGDTYNRVNSSGNATVQDLQTVDYLVVDERNPEELSYQDALILAMKKEKAAYRLYSDMAARTEDAEIKMLLLSLADEEARHKLRFEVEYDDNVLREN